MASIFDGYQAISLDSFLNNHWQQLPVVLRELVPVNELDISADELAGLSLEEDVESRIVVNDGDDYVLHNGPFDESIFETLGEGRWSLLVQAVDLWNQSIHQLMNRFSFVPNWRRDDVMISFSTEGAHVGPHYDHYDVFLIQASGKRTWKTGGYCNRDTDRDTNCESLDLVLDEDFDEAHTLLPGDVLYVPPGVRHWGVTDEAGMTISIGFRAPSAAELLSLLAKEVEDEYAEDLRFSDAKRSAAVSSGELAHEDVARAQALMRSIIDNDQQFAAWFGALMTEPKYDELLPYNDRIESELDHLDAVSLVRDPCTRCAYYRSGDELVWLINGEIYHFAAQSSQASIAILLSDNVINNFNSISELADDTSREWLDNLLEDGSFYVHE